MGESSSCCIANSRQQRRATAELRDYVSKFRGMRTLPTERRKASRTYVSAVKLGHVVLVHVGCVAVRKAGGFDAEIHDTSDWSGVDQSTFMCLPSSLFGLSQNFAHPPLLCVNHKWPVFVFESESECSALERVTTFTREGRTGPSLAETPSISLANGLIITHRAEFSLYLVSSMNTDSLVRQSVTLPLCIVCKSPSM